GRDTNEVLAALKPWAASLDDERVKLEALWVSWGADHVDTDLLNELLNSEDHRIRSAAARVLRFNPDLEGRDELLLAAAEDDHGRVRLEAITAGSRETEELGLAILAKAESKEIDRFMKTSFEASKSALEGKILADSDANLRIQAPKHLTGADKKLYIQGAELYNREAHCGTCHQANGKGLPDAGFPPVAGTQWATGDPDRLIKLSLKGLMGPIEVLGKEYPGNVPMTPFEHLLKDEELAATLTYVRNSFGNKASPISAKDVARVREAVIDKKDMYNPADLLKEHPHVE
ncbi:MAG: c-type cytochrome, partial [Verrucomicrobiota bacterium]